MTRAKKPTPRRSTRTTRTRHGRKWVCASTATPQKIRYSKPLDPTTWDAHPRTTTRWQPKVGQKYWTLCEGWTAFKIYCEVWDDVDACNANREMFGCHRTKRAAASHRTALLAWTTERLGRV